jgi:hypothetical protein
MLKWMVVIACVSGFLGLAGSLVIFCKVHTQNTEESTFVNNEHTRVSMTDDVVLTEQDQKYAADENNFGDDTIIYTTKVSEENIASKRIDTIDDFKVTMPYEDKSQSEQEGSKLLSPKALHLLLADINIAETKYNLSTRCINLCQINMFHNQRLYNQIEQFLLNRKFIISSKETISRAVTGIEMTPKNGCLRIVIGKF